LKERLQWRRDMVPSDPRGMKKRRISLQTFMIGM
jgi:hypothetical protein